MGDFLFGADDPTPAEMLAMKNRTTKTVPVELRKLIKIIDFSSNSLSFFDVSSFRKV